MRRLLKNLTNLSLLQQLGVIIVTFGIGLIFFFTVYLRGNINDFVNSQVMGVLKRSQDGVVSSMKSHSQGVSEFAYDADVIHFVYSRNKCTTYIGKKILNDSFIKQVDEIILNHNEGWVESEFESLGSRYFYYLNTIDGGVEVISIIDETYGKAIENELLSSVSNTSAIVFSLIFFLLTIWVGTIITPLQQIKNYIEKIKRGEDPSLQMDRKDEIGEVAVALVSMREEIIRQEETKEEMIHNISHDLKTPIATIKSYAESIKDGIYPYDTLEKSVDVIAENAERLEKKVHSLLFLNRLDFVMEQEKATDAVTDMKVLIESVLLSLKMIRPEVKIDIDLQPAIFKGEEESWRVVISNLLDNALRYAESNIHISLEPYMFAISNDGPSLSADRIKKLFKPFEKGDKGKFGLGLSICYKVCNAYGYNIVAENLEKGVIFRIDARDIPVKKEKKSIIPVFEKKKEN